MSKQNERTELPGVGVIGYQFHQFIQSILGLGVLICSKEGLGNVKSCFSPDAGFPTGQAWGSLQGSLLTGGCT
ncbi:MAG: hypothetical protein R3C03_16860 [Pirellulaceae bacterium]